MITYKSTLKTAELTSELKTKHEQIEGSFAKKGNSTKVIRR